MFILIATYSSSSSSSSSIEVLVIIALISAFFVKEWVPVLKK